MIVPIGVGDGHPRAVIAVQGGDQAPRSGAAAGVGRVLFVARQVRLARRAQEASAAIEVGMAAVEGACYFKSRYAEAVKIIKILDAQRLLSPKDLFFHQK